MNIRLFWKAVLEQDRVAMRRFFQNTAYVDWHCTGECSTMDEFIRANCEYPGDRDGKVERVECVGSLIMTTAHVSPKDRPPSFHVISFFRIEDEKIVPVDEYWSDDGETPLWRKEIRIGKPID